MQPEAGVGAITAASRKRRVHLQFSEITSLAVVTVVAEADVVAGDADAIVDADSIVDADVAVAAEVPVSADMALAVVLVTVVSGPLVGAWQLARVALAPRI